MSLFIALRFFVLLTYLWVPAWAAVLLVDFFVFRRGRYASDQLTRGRQGIYWYRGGVFWRAFIAWLVGVAVTIPFIQSAEKHNRAFFDKKERP